MDLFVYGSLLAAEVVDGILGAGASARLEWTPARLEVLVSEGKGARGLHGG